MITSESEPNQTAPMRRTAQLVVLVLAALVFPTSLLAQGETGEFFNPFLAYKNLEVGQFYLKKKNYDAAIERFLEALRHKPNFAQAHRRLGQAYEKKKEHADALEHYKKYLEILPAAEDAEKIRKRITRLERELARQAARRKR